MFQFSGCDYHYLFYSIMVDCLLRQPGFPIRKSPDQSVFAAPRSLSQLTTSFVASYRQGIHLLPVTVCLPVSYIKIWVFVACSNFVYYSLWRWTVKELKRFSFLRYLDFSVRWWALVDSNHRPPRYQHDALTNWAKSPNILFWKWWSQTDSNRRHPACKAGALPTELWPRNWMANR